MTEPVEPQHVSPYSPPPIIADDHLFAPETVNANRLSTSMIVAYSLFATILTVGIPILSVFIKPSDSFSAIDQWLPLFVVCLPPLAVAGFVVLCFTIMSGAATAPIRSLWWKTLMVVTVPLASMILFIPTCIGSGVFVMSTAGQVIGEYGFLIPVFFAFWFTCTVVAIRMRRLFTRRDPNLIAPFPDIEPTTID